MQIIKPGINLNIIGKSKIVFSLSMALIVISILSLIFHKGPRYGIDFSGGTLIQIKFGGPATIDAIKSGLKAMNLANASVQTFGEESENEYLVRTDASADMDEAFSSKLKSALDSATQNESEIRRVEMVGPQVGKDLQEKALFAIFYTLLFIAIYISGRFELKWVISGVMAAALTGAVYLFSLFQVSVAFLIAVALIVTLILFWVLSLRYAMGAIVALIHDIIITVGLFSLMEKEFSLPIIAALLTIIGYSLNDTIIVFDRIRENLKKYHKESLAFIINRSVNETLSRTILTSLTTLIVVFSLFVLGGGIIHDFAFALLIGIVIGTYSSIYVASPILLFWEARGRRASG
ncbi:MAG: protein translocase subunit SecF [Desulfobacterales bacterium]